MVTWFNFLKVFTSIQNYKNKWFALQFKLSFSITELTKNAGITFTNFINMIGKTEVSQKQ